MYANLWIQTCIILHCFCIDIEIIGPESDDFFF